MKLALECYGQAAIGCRKLATVLSIFLKPFQQKSPHHTTIRNWIWRCGYAILTSPKESGDDWIAIGDLTVSLGKMKVLAVMGVKKSKIENRDDLTLNHKDVEVLQLAPCIRSNGKFVCDILNNAAKCIKGSLMAVVIDRGPDVKKGTSLFKENNPSTKILHDISHKLSNVMEKNLKNDPLWIDYTGELTLARHRVQQTEFTALMPPVQRRDARFMDIRDIVFWKSRINEIKKRGNLKEIPEERFNEYLGWLNKYTDPIAEWEIMVEACEMIKEITRKCWLSKDIYEYIKNAVGYFEIAEGKAKEFIKEALETLHEEAEKLTDDEKILCSTEVLESIFGKYKQINVGSQQGVSGNVLGICIFTGRNLTQDQIITNMERCSTKIVKKWVEENVSETIGKLRKKFFKKENETKFDEKFEVKNVA